jgi:hypothetical protein
MIGRNLEEIFQYLKKEFNALWNIKPRGETLEIITPFSTTRGEFVSVFVTWRKDTLIVADGARLSVLLDNPKCSSDRVVEYFRGELGVSETKRKGDEASVFFKKCSSEELLPVAVYDLALFVSSCVNHDSYSRSREHEHQKQFAGVANEFVEATVLKTKKHEGVTIRRNHKLDDVGATFSSVLFSPSQGRMILVSCITGSTRDYFKNSMNKAIVNMELAETSKYSSVVDARLSIIDDEAAGYGDMNMSVHNLLTEKLTAEPVRWKDRETLTDLIKFSD